MEDNEASNPSVEEAPATDNQPISGENPPGAEGNGQPAGAEAAPAGVAEPAEPEPVELSLEEQLAAAQQDTLAMRDKMLRVAADFDNYRKRAIRDADDAGRRSKKSVVVELLPVFDNLERALAHGDGAETDNKSLVDGLRMVHRQFLGAISKLGMVRLDALGEAFDPAVHDSIQHLHSAEYAAGQVMAVLQPGYRLGDELVRPAMVVVSKGPEPASEPPAPPSATDDDADGAAAEGAAAAATDTAAGGDDSSLN